MIHRQGRFPELALGLCKGCPRRATVFAVAVPNPWDGLTVSHAVSHLRRTPVWPSRGTTFTLYLPHVEPVSGREDGERLASLPPEPSRGRRDLVVEDNVEVGTFATQLLNDLGYETTWAVDANDALERLAEARGAFDVIFSDVVMPGRSGVELSRQIRRRYPKLPIVLTSGCSHTLAEEGRHGLEFLRKPYTVEDLSRVLARIVPSQASD
jgi:CheY-like chemotaxis protein